MVVFPAISFRREDKLGFCQPVNGLPQLEQKRLDPSSRAPQLAQKRPRLMEGDRGRRTRKKTKNRTVNNSAVPIPTISQTHQATPPELASAGLGVTDGGAVEGTSVADGGAVEGTGVCIVGLGLGGGLAVGDASEDW